VGSQKLFKDTRSSHQQVRGGIDSIEQWEEIVGLLWWS
jgi:hypothetical protein